MPGPGEQQGLIQIHLFLVTSFFPTGIFCSFSLQTQKKPEYVLNMISGITNALGNWYKYVDEKVELSILLELSTYQHL